MQGSNKRIGKDVKKAKEDWIGTQSKEIETCLNKNNSKRVYQVVKKVTSSENCSVPQLYRTGVGSV